jgi:hypothetical protein
MGLISERPSNYIDIIPVRTVLMYVWYAVSLAVSFKRNRALLFIGLYVGVMCFATFALVNIVWSQERFMLIYYPFILVFLLGGVYYLLRLKALRKLFFIYPLFLLVLCFGTLTITFNRIGRNLPVLQQNLLGDPLYGLNPDWQNFIRGSQWAARNLDKDAVIASRKPSISKVYTGRDFTTFGTIKTPLDVLDALPADGRTIFVINATKQIIEGRFVRYVVAAVQPFTVDGQKTNRVCVYDIPNEDAAEMTQMLKDAQISYTTDCDDFLKQCKSADNIRVYDPDLMLEQLIDQKIDYLLLPQLRHDPTRKTGVYINNIHLAIQYISYKYPGRFKTVHTVGNDEPCEIVQFLK